MLENPGFLCTSLFTSKSRTEIEKKTSCRRSIHLNILQWLSVRKFFKSFFGQKIAIELENNFHRSECSSCRVEKVSFVEISNKDAFRLLGIHFNFLRKATRLPLLSHLELLFHRNHGGIMEFFLNRVALSLNSVNSGNLKITEA